MPDDTIRFRPGDGRTSSQGAAVLAAVESPKRPSMAPTPSGLAGRSPSGAPVLTRAGGASTAGSEPGGRVAHGPAATPSTKSDAAAADTATASTPTQIDPTKEYRQ